MNGDAKPPAADGAADAEAAPAPAPPPTHPPLTRAQVKRARRRGYNAGLHYSFCGGRVAIGEFVEERE